MAEVSSPKPETKPIVKNSSPLSKVWQRFGGHTAEQPSTPYSSTFSFDQKKLNDYLDYLKFDTVLKGGMFNNTSSLLPGENINAKESANEAAIQADFIKQAAIIDPHMETLAKRFSPDQWHRVMLAVEKTLGKLSPSDFANQIARVYPKPDFWARSDLETLDMNHVTKIIEDELAKLSPQTPANK